ncbi:MAG: protein kinase [Anaerolineae bacterium]|nr:protein kinase [Anaerolineae bacterium]
MPLVCPKCGTVQPYETDFCISCGAPLRTRCPSCGALITPGARRCPQCGARLGDALSFEDLFGAPTTLQGRYAIEKRLKRGHATTVYLAYDQALGRRCVIKEFNPRRLADDFERDEAQRSFHAEAARWAQIRHPNLVRIQDMFIQAGRSYLVMDLIRGRSLRRIIADPGAKIDETDAVAWTLQICDALTFLHSQTPPLIFGDLHPRHVMVTSDGQVKLVDFGLSAWFMPWNLGVPRYQGSPGYAAPEQRERQEADERSDIYALGGLLYHLLTRQAPNQPPIRLNELPPALAKIIRRARQRSPEQRFPSAQAMQRALRKAAPGISARPRPVEKPKEVVSPSPFSTIAEAVPRITPTTPRQVDIWAEVRAQMAEQVRNDWLRTVRRFYSGRTLEWLQREAARAMKKGQTEAAERISQAISKAEDLIPQGELENALGRQVVVARWLADVGAVPDVPSFSVHPQRLTFGGLTRRVAKRTTLRVQNSGPSTLVGEVESSLPWLEVRTPWFNCKSGETARVVVVAHGSQLPAAGERAARAVRVITNQGTIWVPALATLIVPSLTVSPASVDFGWVRPGQSAQAEIVVANAGGGEIQGIVRSSVTWLEISSRRFQLGAEERQTIRLTFHGDLAPRGVEKAPDVLVVDSDYGQARLPVRWRWAEPRLVVEPAELDWGARERGSEDSMVLTISNPGQAPLEGTVLSRCEWLEVIPDRFVCQPGESTVVTVHARLSDLPSGRVALGEALVIESNAGRRAIPASVTVLAPELRVKPVSVDLGEAEWGDVRRGTLRIRNVGTMPLTARVESLFPWLHVEPAELSCPPDESVRVALEARTEEMLHGGDWRATPGVRIVSNAGTREVPISLLVSKPELQTEPDILDFGVIPRHEVGQVTLYISNPGTAPLVWSLSSDALWLEITTPQGVTQPGETSQIQLYAYGLAVPADQDEAQMTLIVESNAGERSLQGRIAIARPQLWVAPPLLDLGVSVNYTPVEGLLSLFNRGIGELTGTVQARVPWLTVEPAEFRIPTGGQQPITVRALPENLREGETQVEEAIEVDSNAGQDFVDVRLEVQLSGQLVIEPEEIRWALGEEPPMLRLSNTGYAPLSVDVRPQAAWLQVNHELVIVKHGRAVQIALAVDETALPADSPIETEITLAQDGQEIIIPVSVMRRAPRSD